MNTLLLKQDTIKADLEPAKFEARGVHPFGWHLGKVTLQLDHEGIHLINKKGKTYSTTNWADVEDLRNNVRQTGRFAYRGKVQNAFNEVQMFMRFAINDGDREKLAQMFDKLPPDVFGQKCPGCGGVVVDNMCKSCGETFTGQQRRKGIRLMMVGSVVLLIGILLTYATYNAQSGAVFVFYGAMLIGAGMVIGGLIGLIFGARV
ncbi:MAG TPA: hypothetical protein VIF81_03375 [Pyrinomonadaceae bacterium]|jgi:hypothetical protein